MPKLIQIGSINDPLTGVVHAIRMIEAAKALIEKNEDLQPIRDKYQKEVAKIFRKQGKMFMESFQIFENQFEEKMKAVTFVDDSKFIETPSTSDVDRILDNIFAVTNREWVEPTREAYEGSMTFGAMQWVPVLGEDLVAFNIGNPRAQDWIIKNGARLITQVNETTRFQIKNILKKGIEKGYTYDTMAKQITKRFSEFAIGKPQQHIQSRAHLVAVTETANAYESGGFEGVKQMQDVGLQLEKEWSTTGDNRVSDGCIANEDEGWIELDNNFESGHSHPPRFPGCRCAALYRRKTI